jgi:glycosyltransferase involved in cell wall biosynthesis
MKILHVTPHLGGGVGKAHAALSSALPDAVEQTFVLLEEPRDCRHLERIAAGEAAVIVTDDLDAVAALAREADIVQFEFWNHPRLFECLARAAFPAMRSVFWSHISGLFRPFIPPGLMREAGRFAFTTEASRALPSRILAKNIAAKKTAVVNSGFACATRPERATRRKPAIAYLGTVDFVKMHPGFFDAIDRLVGGDIRVAVWGAADAAVMARARAMRHPERIELRGETAEPEAALAGADIFFYPLQPDHYGTAENALVEAMSLGLVPVVLGNPAERAIVRDGETGFVAQTIDDCVSILQMLLLLPDLREKLSRCAIRDIAETRTPDRSAHDFMVLWLGLLAEAPRRHDFRGAIGDSPADWFLATQCLPGATWELPRSQRPEAPAKGTLAHYESVFAGDASLTRLRRLGRAQHQVARRRQARAIA